MNLRAKTFLETGKPVNSEHYQHCPPNLDVKREAGFYLCWLGHLH